MFKKLIAREGLVLLGFITVGVLNVLVCNFTNNNFFHLTFPVLLISLYPIYLTGRFALWALRVLKG